MGVDWDAVFILLQACGKLTITPENLDLRRVGQSRRLWLRARQR